MEHQCDKALVIQQQGDQIANLFDRHRDGDKRLTETETTLFGAERNGGGFIREMRDSQERVIISVDGISSRVGELAVVVQRHVDRSTGFREILKVSIPPIAVGAMAILLWLITNGRAP